eukprot:5096390-Amphidinium_carterae.1
MVGLHLPTCRIPHFAANTTALTTDGCTLTRKDDMQLKQWLAGECHLCTSRPADYMHSTRNTGRACSTLAFHARH